MLMSVIEHESGVPTYPELAGARVLITGLRPGAGIEVARAFAEHKARLLLQTDRNSREIEATATALAEKASEIRLHASPFTTGDAAVHFVRSAVQAHGGLDVVIDFVTVEPEDLVGRASFESIEDLVSEKLLASTLITRVAANRMGLTRAEGLVLNIVRMSSPVDDSAAMLAGIMRSALAAMTRVEAANWSAQAVRINAVGPRSLPGFDGAANCLASDADIAALALYLASRKGRQLSGHVFDAEGVARRGC